MTETAIQHPDYRPGHGEKRADREVILRAEAAEAHLVWTRIWRNRQHALDPYKDIRRDVVDQAISDGGLRGGLLLAAVGDATARTLLPESGYTRPEWDRDRFAAYEMATALHDRYVVAVPPQPSLVPAGYAEETCSHGRRFDAECSDCGA